MIPNFESKGKRGQLQPRSPLVSVLFTHFSNPKSVRCDLPFNLYISCFFCRLKREGDREKQESRVAGEETADRGRSGKTGVKGSRRRAGGQRKNRKNGGRGGRVG